MLAEQSMFTKFTSAYPMSEKLQENPLQKNSAQAHKKTFTRDEAKYIAIESTRATYGIEKQLKELTENQLPTVAFDKEAPEDVGKNINAVSLAYSLESGLALTESVEERYRPLSLQMKRDLEGEFECKAPSERAVVDQIVISYIRKLSFSRFLEDRKEQCILSSEKNGYLNFISKEIDRAHRQFLSALETLKIIKQPALNVNIKAQNTFVAQNQQINNPSEKINEAT